MKTLLKEIEPAGSFLLLLLMTLSAANKQEPLHITSVARDSACYWYMQAATCNNPYGSKPDTRGPYRSPPASGIKLRRQCAMASVGSGITAYTGIFGGPVRGAAVTIGCVA